MIDIFSKQALDVSKVTCHTGGAAGSDSVFEQVSLEYGAKVCAYSYKTDFHNSPNKIEITDEEYNE